MMARREHILLPIILLAGIALRLYFHAGVFARDDLKYAHYGYFLFESDDVKREEVLQYEGQMYLRMGFNIPIWVATRVFGVHEWSVILVPFLVSTSGILLVWILARRLADPNAGLLAAGLWACLPADVYLAGVCQPDALSGSLTVLLLLLIVAADESKIRKWVPALGAGLVLGVTQYVKISGLLLLAPLAVWALIRTVQERRVPWFMGAILGGLFLAQCAVAILFLSIKGDLFFYWKGSYDFWFRLAERWPHSVHTLPDIVAQLKNELLHLWGVGYCIIIFPLAVVIALADRRTKYRLLMSLLCLAQWYAVYRVLHYANVSQRYILHWSAFFVLAIALATHTILSRAPARWAAVLWPVVSVALVLATALGLSKDRQQLGRDKGECLRRVHAYLQDNAGQDDAIYVDFGHRTYTLRALYLLNGFRRVKGGFRRLEEADSASSGWVVISNLESGLRKESYVPGDNAFEVCSSVRRRNWARVFKILTLPPVRTTRALLPIPLTSAARGYKSSWVGASKSVSVERDAGGGIRCEVVGGDDASKHSYGGLTFPVRGFRALRLWMSFLQPENIDAVWAWGSADRKSRSRTARWEWRPGPDDHAAMHEIIPYDFSPGTQVRPFKHTASEDAERLKTMTVILQLKRPSRSAGFILHRAEGVAHPTSASAIGCPENHVRGWRPVHLTR